MFDYTTPQLRSDPGRGDMGSDLVVSMAPVLVATAIPTLTQTLPLVPGDVVVAALDRGSYLLVFTQMGQIMQIQWDAA